MTCYAPPDRGTLEGILREGAVAAGKWELVLAASSGEIPVQMSATPLDVDGIQAVCVIVTDLRERLRNEEIVASETLARSILDQAAAAIVVCDAHGRIIRANDSAVQLCGENPLFRFFPEAFPLDQVGLRRGTCPPCGPYDR